IISFNEDKSRKRIWQLSNKMENFDAFAVAVPQSPLSARVANRGERGNFPPAPVNQGAQGRATSPKPSHKSTEAPQGRKGIPRATSHAVWVRDGGCCTSWKQTEPMQFKDRDPVR